MSHAVWIYTAADTKTAAAKATKQADFLPPAAVHGSAQ